jgi:hypothetical protein
MNGRALGFNGRVCASGGSSSEGWLDGHGARSGNKVRGGVVLGTEVGSGGRLGNEGGRRRRRTGVAGVEIRGGKSLGLNAKS